MPAGPTSECSSNTTVCSGNTTKCCWNTANCLGEHDRVSRPTGGVFVETPRVFSRTQSRITTNTTECPGGQICMFLPTERSVLPNTTPVSLNRTECPHEHDRMSRWTRSSVQANTIPCPIDTIESADQHNRLSFPPQPVSGCLPAPGSDDEVSDRTRSPKGSGAEPRRERRCRRPRRGPIGSCHPRGAPPKRDELRLAPQPRSGERM